jgi:hypothetical protein
VGIKKASHNFSLPMPEDIINFVLDIIRGQINSKALKEEK